MKSRNMKTKFLQKCKNSLKVNAIFLAMLSMLLILSPMVALAAKNENNNRGKKPHVVTPPGKLKLPVTPPGKAKNKK